METAILGGCLAALAAGGIAHALTYISDDIAVAPESIPSISFEDFEATARTGDLLLTSSTSITSVSRLLTGSLWSHCGILYIDDSNDVLLTTTTTTTTTTTRRRTRSSMYEWSSHSPGEQVYDRNGMRGINGTQLVPLSYLAADNGTVFWRRVALTDEQRDDIASLVRKMYGKIAFSEALSFAACIGGPIGHVFNDYGIGMACSHVVASTYAFANALLLDRPLTQYTPETFSDTGDARWTADVEKTRMITNFNAKRGLIKLFV